MLGWRGVFAIATFPAIVIALLARKLKETPQFINMREVRNLVRQGKHEEARRLSEQFGVPLKAAGQRERRLPLLQVFERSQRKHTVFLCLGFLLNWFGVQVFAVLGTTVLLEAHDISLGSSLVVLIVSNAVAFVGYVAHGIIGDKIGRRETIMAGWLLSGLAYALMLFAVDSYAGVFALYTIGLFFLIGPYAALLFYMGESYPTRVRGSGTAMANAMGPIGAIFGSALLTGLLSTGLDMVMSAFITGALTIFLSGLCLLGARRVRPGAPLVEETEAVAAA